MKFSRGVSTKEIDYLQQNNIQHFEQFDQNNSTSTLPKIFNFIIQH